MIYPVCYKSFINWLNTNQNYNFIYQLIGSPRPFDVTLRDGLQSLSIIKKTSFGSYEDFTTKKKYEIYKIIMEYYNPEFIEIGALVSSRILPIFADSIELYKKCISNNKLNYILIPNISKLDIIKDLNCKNISLITSVSDKFQEKNTKKNIDKTKEDIKNIITNFNGNIKLYISCIDNCPIIGSISHEIIINELEYYYKKLNITNLCLSDTCGTLSNESFINIIDQANLCGIPYKSFSLHLHVNNKLMDSINNTIKIIHSALDRGICRFDVSLLETGGCSVTMGSNAYPNLSYELYYKALVDYIKSKDE
jgi:isopropylmalate/homocitrate/citramalate synthase